MDKIVIRTNAMLDKMEDWYFTNKDWISKNPPQYDPLSEGVIVLPEQYLEITFRTINKSLMNFQVRMYSPQLAQEDILPFTYDLNTMKYKVALPHQMPKDAGLLWAAIHSENNSMAKAVNIWMTITMFMMYYKEFAVVSEEMIARTNPHKKHNRKKNLSKISLLRKTYTFDEETFAGMDKVFKEKRGWTEPDHQVRVRGHYRHYKNGKVVWIKSFSKYNDKPHADKTYYA